MALLACRRSTLIGSASHRSASAPPARIRSSDSRVTLSSSAPVGTIFVPVKKAPPKPKPTITRAKAVALANTFLKENVGKAALFAPRASRFRLGSIVDRGGIINVLFCHEANDFDPTITSLGAKCLDALVAAHPQLRAFELEVQTIRM